MIPQCIVCGYQPESAIGDKDPNTNQPYMATKFTTGGHYGSTIYDPMSGREYLELNICDACLIKAAEQGRVLITHVTEPQPECKSEEWNPQEEFEWWRKEHEDD